MPKLWKLMQAVTLGVACLAIPVAAQAQFFDKPGFGGGYRFGPPPPIIYAPPPRIWKPPVYYAPPQRFYHPPPPRAFFGPPTPSSPRPTIFTHLRVISMDRAPITGGPMTIAGTGRPAILKGQGWRRWEEPPAYHWLPCLSAAIPCG